MKRVGYILIVIVIAIVSYQLGWHHGTQTSKTTAANYQELYNQAITWQETTDCAVPNIMTNQKLKEKPYE